MRTVPDLYGARIVPGRRLIATRLSVVTPQCKLAYDFIGTRAELDMLADRHELNVYWSCDL